MFRKILILALLLQLCSTLFAVENLECNWVPQSSCDPRDAIFYAHSTIFNNNVNGQPNEFMSSHVSLVGNSNYDSALCCTSPLNVVSDRLSFYGEATTNNQCTNNDQALLFLTNNTNGILALNESYNPAFHNYVICADLPQSASAARFEIDNTDFYKDRGYQCVFRLSNITNGRVSSCEGRYGFGSNQYSFAIWAKLIESDSSLRCNADCTSNLDSRVYSSCAQRIPACYNVPSACDGSLYGGWVELPADRDGDGLDDIDQFGNHRLQINCEAPWDKERINPEYVDSNSQSNIVVDSVEGACKNILSQEYSVLVDNIPYKMNMYICSND